MDFGTESYGYIQNLKYTVLTYKWLPKVTNFENLKFSDELNLYLDVHVPGICKNYFVWTCIALANF